VWTADEERAVLELVAAGVQLWNSCPVRANPRSASISDRQPGVGELESGARADN
jgi:hypothetical protein